MAGGQRLIGPHEGVRRRMERERERETKKRDTEIFNGYAEHVSNLYSDMDLKKFF